MTPEFRNSEEWRSWRRRFVEVISDDDLELDAAADAAVRASLNQAGDVSAEAAGRAAAHEVRRSGRGDASTAAAADAGSAQSPDGGSLLAEDLASRIFRPPQRWGWQAASAPKQADLAPLPEPPAPWVDTPLPDAHDLRTNRSRAVSRLVWRLAFTVVVVGAFLAYRSVIEDEIGGLGSAAQLVYLAALWAIALVLVVGVIRGIATVSRASRAIRASERPAAALRAAEKERHRLAVKKWEEAVREHERQIREADESLSRAARGPLWYPVHPASDPVRVDVFGGDPRRFGWASLVVTMGTSLLAAGQQILLIDFTGQDVGGDLADVASAGTYRVREADLAVGGADLDLLGGVDRDDVADCLAEAIAPRDGDADLRQERALIAYSIEAVIESLDPPVTLERLAAGVNVLRLAEAGPSLTEAERTRLTALVGDFEQNEWTARQLRFVASQLRALDAVAAGGPGSTPFWTDEPLSIVASVGGSDDRKEVLDRLLLMLLRHAIDRHRLSNVVVILAGVDQLGPVTMRVFSEHARNAGVRLVMMIDQPQGDIEKSVGLGGAVCFMKMYNHRDATIAAEFIGKGYTFVLNQVTRQVGQTFNDGGGDTYSTNSSIGTSSKAKGSGARGRKTGISDSRGSAWSAVRNWSTADNISTSTSSSRVYEFTVEPSELLGMPETSFLLVDNSGSGRRVLMADANPAICLSPRLSETPA